jgi:hypothetical protein
MKAEFVDYLKAIGMTEPLIERVDSVHSFYETLLHDEVTDIFVSEYVTEDGIRQYESLWFFSAEYVLEAKQFIKQDDFDITPIRGLIKYWKVEKKEYDFREATTASRCTVIFTTEPGTSATFKASGMNCDKIRDIALRLMIPNLVKSTNANSPSSS